MRIVLNGCLALLLGGAVWTIGAGGPGTARAQDELPACDAALAAAVGREVRLASKGAGQEPLLVMIVSRSETSGEELTSVCLPVGAAGTGPALRGRIDEVPGEGEVGTADVRPSARPVAAAARTGDGVGAFGAGTMSTQNECYTYTFKKKQYVVCP